MKTEKWFDRKFDFNFGAERFSNLKARLRDAPKTITKEVVKISENTLIVQQDGKWSIKENIGHLSLLEPLWLKRLEEIKNGIEKMSPADLNNTATDEAHFNNLLLSDLIEKFKLEREKTMNFLDRLDPEHLKNTSLHPRLLESMRILDLMYFVAEHDDHHLLTLKKIIHYENSKHHSNHTHNP